MTVNDPKRNCEQASATPGFVNAFKEQQQQLAKQSDQINSKCDWRSSNNSLKRSGKLSVAVTRKPQSANEPSRTSTFT
jgi:hypothetical protein